MGSPHRIASMGLCRQPPDRVSYPLADYGPVACVCSQRAQGGPAGRDVHDPDKAIASTLKDDRYARLVVEVEDPVVTLAAIAKAIKPPAAPN